MNGSVPQRTHTALVVVCVTILATIASVIGGWLLWKGFSGGGEMIITLNTAISGLIGFLGGRVTNTPSTPSSEQPQPQPNSNH